MKQKSKRIPLLEPGVAQCAMQMLLSQVKHQRGLTTFIENRGVNGKWLMPKEPYDITVSRFFKIVLLKAQYQNEEEFLMDWMAIGKKMVRVVHYVFKPNSY